MNALFLLLGTGLLLVALVDALWTTLWVDGNAGPLSSRLTTWIWHATRASLRRRHDRWMSINGPLTLVVIASTWVILLWAGWTFIFAGGDDALLHTRDQTPASWTGRIYFVAYTMFTTGNGDFTPKEGVWQLVTSLTTGSGMVLVTLVVSYVLSVLSAVVQKRSFASQVTALGKRSEDLVIRSWNGRDFLDLDLPLNTYATQLGTLTEQHLAYPILYYFHAKRSTKASAVAVTILDEALTILQCGVPEKHRPSPAILRVARETVGSYLDALGAVFIVPADEHPPSPDLNRLRQAGIPTLSDEELGRALKEERDRRKRLLGALQNGAWQWPPVEGR